MTPTRRPVGVIAMSVLVVLVTAAGCGGGGKGTGLSTSAATRRPMPSCGAYVARDDDLSAEDRAVRDCFLGAFREGREAEVTITATSIEGDPITTIYRVLGRDDLELFVDASADTFAAVKTDHQRCTSVTAEGTALAAGGCATVT